MSAGIVVFMVLGGYCPGSVQLLADTNAVSAIAFGLI